MPITIKGDRFDFIDSNGNTEASLYMSNGVASVDGVPLGGGGGSVPPLYEGEIYIGDVSEEPVSTAISGDITLGTDGTVTLGNGAVTGQALTGITIEAGAVTSSSTILEACGYFQHNITTIAQETTGQITQAQILDLAGNPFALLPTIDSALAYVVDELQILHAYSVAAYTAGSDLILKYGGGSSLALLDSTFLTGVSNVQSLIKPSAYDLDATTGTSTGFDLQTQGGKSIVLTVSGADFTAGSAGNKIFYRLRYHVVNMLSSD